MVKITTCPASECPKAEWRWNQVFDPNRSTVLSDFGSAAAVAGDYRDPT
jgi:hypothetical protein